MSDVAMPRGWMQAEIGELCDLINGRAFKPAEWSDEGLPIIRIQNLNNSNAPFNHFDGEVADKHRIRYGDLLFAWSGTPGTSFGAHVWIGGEAALNQHIFKVGFDESKIDKRFLRYAINQTLDELVAGAHGGVGLRHVTKGKFEKTRVAFPPLKEQKAIAVKLDQLLAQVNNMQARLGAIPAILKRFRQSVLEAAVSGELPSSPLSYQSSRGEVELGSLLLTAFDGPFGSKLKTSDYTGAGVGVSRLENIRHLWFDGSKKTYISKEKYEGLKGNKLEKNDVLFSSFVDEEVRVCLFPYEGVEYINKADCFCLRADSMKVMPKFLMFLLASHGSCFQIKGHVQGVTRPRVNLKILKSLKFRVPGVDEQAEIVHRVDKLFAFADQIEQQVANAQSRVNKLTQSILAKAFRGELTAEWRAENPELISGDNSAEALLERIKAEKEPLTATKKRRGGRKAVAAS